jgi:hypothetical protein
MTADTARSSSAFFSCSFFCFKRNIPVCGLATTLVLAFIEFDAVSTIQRYIT